MAIANIAPELTGTYQIDPAHSRFGFVARHAMITKVRGSFNDFSGTGYLDAADPSKSHAELVIKAASIDTRNDDRDKHLRSNDFFDMDQFPEIRFATTEVKAAGENRFRVTGELTIKATTKPVSFDLEFTGAAIDPFGNERIGLEASTVINRRDWNVNWNAPLEAGGVLVGENVTLELEISAIKTAPD